MLGGAGEDTDFGFCSAGIEGQGESQCCLNSLSGRSGTASGPHGSGDQGLNMPCDTRRRCTFGGEGRG